MAVGLCHYEYLTITISIECRSMFDNTTQPPIYCCSRRVFVSNHRFDGRPDYGLFSTANKPDKTFSKYRALQNRMGLTQCLIGASPLCCINIIL